MLGIYSLMFVILSMLCSSNVSAQATSEKRPGPKFSSVYTDLSKECKNAFKEGELTEGQDMPQKCKGYGGYSPSIGYSALLTHIGIETNDGQTLIALNPGKGVEVPGTKLEWRLADGKPFAVILRYTYYKEDYPVGESPFQDKYKMGESLIVKGLKGYEQKINFEVDARTPKVNEKARELADNAFLQSH